MPKWSFDTPTADIAHDGVSGTEDRIEGQFKYVPGVTDAALRFDEYTARVIREGAKAPKIGSTFSEEAWGVLDAYPGTGFRFLIMCRISRLGSSSGSIHSGI